VFFFFFVILEIYCIIVGIKELEVKTE